MHTIQDQIVYRRDIDGLRAIAVLSVVGFHAAHGRIPGGFVGVDVFFVISGFLISSIILRGLGTGHFSFNEFYSRRIKRIFPALSIVLLASLTFGYLFLLDDELKQLGKHVMAGSAFFANFTFLNESGYFDQSADMKPMLHLWSLGIEEQFYIIWPLLLWLAWNRKYELSALIALAILASFALSLSQSDGMGVSAFFSPFTRFWELLVGAGVALASTRSSFLPISKEPLSSVASIIAIGVLAATVLFIDQNRSYPGWWAVLPTLSTAVIIWAGQTALPNRWLLSNKFLVWVGLISFPLYLWHWPILSFLRIIEGTEIAQWKRFVAIIVSIFLSYLTYRLIERPVRKSARHKPVAIVLAGLMLVVGLVGANAYYLNGLVWRPLGPKVINAGDVGQLAFFDYIREHSYPCTPVEIRRDAGVWEGVTRCFQSKDQGAKDVAIIGDSHAEHLFPGLAARLPDLNVVFYGKASLPFVDNPDFAKIFQYVIADKHTETIIIAANWSTKFSGIPQEEWKQELIATLNALTHAGKRVYLTDDVPRFSFLPNRCKFVGRLGIVNKCVEPDRYPQSGFGKTFEELTKDNSALRFVKMYDRFCAAGRCSMARDGILLFRDEHHLNISGSIAVADVILGQVGHRWNNIIAADLDNGAK